MIHLQTTNIVIVKIILQDNQPLNQKEFLIKFKKILKLIHAFPTKAIIPKKIAPLHSITLTALNKIFIKQLYSNKINIMKHNNTTKKVQ